MLWRFPHMGTWRAVGALILAVTALTPAPALAQSATTNQCLVANMVHDILFRPATDGDLGIYVPELTASGAGATAGTLLTSTEYRTDFAQAMYGQYLHRPPLDTETNLFVGLLNGGLTDEQVIAFVVGTPEYFTLAGGTNDGFVAQLFHDALGRAPSGDEATLYGALLTGGATDAQVAAGLFATPEYQTRLIQFDYRAFLGHPAAADAVTVLLGLLGTGATDEGLAAGIVGGAEYATLHPCATRLAIHLIVPTAPRVNNPFSVTVESQSGNGKPALLVHGVTVTLTNAAGTGALSGNLTGAIASGATQTTIAGVVYNVAETGVRLAATGVGGDVLLSPTSGPFGVTTPSLNSEITLVTVPTTWTRVQSQNVMVAIKNTGTTTWVAGGANPVTIHAFFLTGPLTQYPGQNWTQQSVYPLSNDVPPGAVATAAFSVLAPGLGNGPTCCSAIGFQAFIEGKSAIAGVVTQAITLLAPLLPTPSLQAAITLTGGINSVPTLWTHTQSQNVTVTLTNTGTQTWAAGGANPVSIRSFFLTGPLTQNPGQNWTQQSTNPLPNDVAPGASATLTFSVKAPGLGAGAGCCSAIGFQAFIQGKNAIPSAVTLPITLN